MSKPSKEIEDYRKRLIQKLTDEARALYSSKDKSNVLRMSGIARAIKIIEETD